MRKLLSVLALALGASPALAQCFDTAYGNPLGTGTLFGDIVFPIQAIGFPFPIGAASYTDVHVCDKGYAWLSNAGTPAPGGADFSPTSAELASQSPRVCALWSDIQVLTSNNGQVYLKSTPTACTITWVNAQCYSATSGLFNMQMVLYPSGQVKFLYGPGTTNASVATQPSWYVGVAGLSPGLGAALPAASDLSAGGATVDPTLYEEWLTINTFDMPNNGLLLVPTSPGYAFVPLGAPANCASTTSFGSGCIQQTDSIYELFSPVTNFDLASSTISFFRQAAGYLVLNSIPGTFVTPSGAAIVIANADDTEQTIALPGAMPVPGGTTSSLTVCSNGRIALGPTGNGASWTPDVPTFLNWANATIAAAWHDYNPTIAGSGSITTEQVGGTVYVTWNAVYSYATTVPDTFQYQFDVATGNVTIVYGTFSNAGNNILTGYSPGGPSTASASDLSVVLGGAVTLFDTATAGLALTTNSSPAFGNSGFALVTTNVPPVVPLGVLFFGSLAINPGLDLSFLGMPGCYGYTNADVTSASFPVAAGTGSVSVPIPSNPTLLNVSLTTQSLAFTLANPANLVTSNGVTFTIGN
ncbi:MAG: hypothetical protein WAT39_22625 [Planctomycetota bacterium]